MNRKTALTMIAAIAVAAMAPGAIAAPRCKSGTCASGLKAKTNPASPKVIKKAILTVRKAGDDKRQDY
jgi:hypothetical protein